MKFDHIIAPELRLLESLQQGTDPLTRKNLQIMHENFVVPYSKFLKSQFTLMEAEMTADQIQQVFGHAERIAGAGGDNKTMLGKGADAVAAGAKGAKDLASKLVTPAVKQKFEASLPAADAGPVEGFEQKATQAVAGIQDPKAKQSLMDKIKIGLQNPATQQLIMAGVSGIAGVIASTATAGLGGYAGAAAAGAITGSLLGAVNSKMQGGSWKDAGKAALKGAAMGAAGGLIGKGVTNAAGAAMDAYQSSQQQAATAGEDPMKADNDLYGPGGSAEEKVMPVTGKPASTPTSNSDLQGAISNDAGTPPSTNPTFGGSQPNQGGEPAVDASAPAAQPSTGFQEVSPDKGDVTTQLKDLKAQGYNVQRSQSDPSMITVTDKQGNLMQQFNPGNPFLASRISSAANGINIRESKKPVIEYIDRELTARMWILHESVGKPRGNVHLTNEGIGDMFKKAGNWLKTKAGNLTNKVTADKLQQAWTKAGSPTDSGQVAAIMAQAGVPQDSVDQIFKNMGLPAGSSTPTQAPAPAAAAPAGPKQGLIGKAAGAVGGAIGSVKGAIAGAKDAFAQGKEQGFDTSRANQAGDAVGATGEQNPYAKGAQQPTGQGQAAPAGTPQQTGGQTPAQGQAAPAGKETPPPEEKGLAAKAGDAVAGAFKDAEAAMRAGVGMGTAGHSLMQTGSQPADSVSIKDAQGIDHGYKKVGQQWFDKDNKPVNSAQAAMLDKQAQQQAALGKDAAKPAAAAEPVKIGGQTLDPNNPADKKIIDKVQAQAGGAQQPAQAQAQQPAVGNKVDWNDASNPVVQKRRERADQLQGGTDPDTGKQIPQDQIPNRLKAEISAYKAGKFDPTTGQPTLDTAAQAPAAKKGNYDPDTGAPMSDKAKSDAAFAASPQGQAIQAKVDAMPAPEPDVAAKPAGQSPEEIRKAKQAAAAKTAQAQMAANPAPAAQATPATPAAKAHTGGKVAGQVSMTPNAIRKRDARAAAAAAKAAPNDVMARMAKQLAPAAAPAATPNFGQQQPGYASVKMNAPTGIPQQPAAQPTTGAKAVPQLDPAQRKAAKADYKKAQATQPASMNNTVASSTGGGFGQAVNAARAKGIATAESKMDFSAILARKAKVRL